MKLADLEQRATITVEEAAALLRIGRNTAYDAIRAGQIPALRLGRRLLVPVPALTRMLEWDDMDGEVPAERPGDGDASAVRRAPRPWMPGEVDQAIRDQA